LVTFSGKNETAMAMHLQTGYAAATKEIVPLSGQDFYELRRVFRVPDHMAKASPAAQRVSGDLIA
jgi:hypothetical protein